MIFIQCFFLYKGAKTKKKILVFSPRVRIPIQKCMNYLDFFLKVKITAP